MTKKKAIEILEIHRRIHKDWSEFLKKHPEFVTTYIGDVVHHERCVKDYESIISLLERL